MCAGVCMYIICMCVRAGVVHGPQPLSPWDWYRQCQSWSGGWQWAATDRFHVCVFLQHLSIKGNII